MMHRDARHEARIPAPRRLGRTARVLALAAALGCLFPSVNRAQNAGPQQTSFTENINYAYSNWLGTGFYQVGSRRAFILGGTLNRPLIEPEPGAGRYWELDLLLPGTIGFYDVPASLEDLGAVTFVPGIQMRLPVTQHWVVRPFIQAGFGTDFSVGETVFIAGGGIKSLTVFPQKTEANLFPRRWFDLELGTALTWGTNAVSANEVGDSGFSLLDVGLNTKWPTEIHIFDRRTDLNVYAIYTEFLNELEFLSADFEDRRISRLGRVGVALTADEGFSLLGFDFRGGGVVLSFGEDYFGIGFNDGFPF